MGVTEPLKCLSQPLNGSARGEHLFQDTAAVFRALPELGLCPWTSFGATCTSRGGHAGAVLDPHPRPLPAAGWGTGGSSPLRQRRWGPCVQGQRCPPLSPAVGPLTNPGHEAGWVVGQGCWCSCSDRAQPSKAGVGSRFGGAWPLLRSARWVACAAPWLSTGWGFSLVPQVCGVCSGCLWGEALGAAPPCPVLPSPGLCAREGPRRWLHALGWAGGCL